MVYEADYTVTRKENRAIQRRDEFKCFKIGFTLKSILKTSA